MRQTDRIELISERTDRQNRTHAVRQTDRQTEREIETWYGVFIQIVKEQRALRRYDLLD